MAQPEPFRKEQPPSPMPRRRMKQGLLAISAVVIAFILIAIIAFSFLTINLEDHDDEWPSSGYEQGADRLLLDAYDLPRSWVLESAWGNSSECTMSLYDSDGATITIVLKRSSTIGEATQLYVDERDNFVLQGAFDSSYIDYDDFDMGIGNRSYCLEVKEYGGFTASSQAVVQKANVVFFITYLCGYSSEAHYSDLEEITELQYDAVHA